MRLLIIIFIIFILSDIGHSQTALDYKISGLDKHKAGDDRGAISDFNKALNINPWDEVAYTLRGIANISLANYNAAILDFNEAIKIKPLDADAYFNRGVAKYNLGDISGASADFAKAIEIRPSYAAVYSEKFSPTAANYLKWGTEKFGSKNYDGAIADFNLAIEIDPMVPDLYYIRAMAKGKIDDFSGAIVDYTKALNLNYSNKSELYYWRANMKGHIGDFRGAIDDFNKAINLNSNYPEAFFGRGLGKMELGDTSGGCLDWSKAGELGHPTVYDWIKKYCK